MMAMMLILWRCLHDAAGSDSWAELFHEDVVDCDEKEKETEDGVDSCTFIKMNTEESFEN